MNKTITFMAVALALSVTACSETETEVAAGPAASEADNVAQAEPAANPFFSESELAFHYPVFDQIDNAHYRPAFERGMEEQMAEIAAITAQEETPTFDNTMVALERSVRMRNTRSSRPLRLPYQISEISLIGSSVNWSRSSQAGIQKVASGA